MAAQHTDGIVSCALAAPAPASATAAVGAGGAPPLWPSSLAPLPPPAITPRKREHTPPTPSSNSVTAAAASGPPPNGSPPVEPLVKSARTAQHTSPNGNNNPQPTATAMPAAPVVTDLPSMQRDVALQPDRLQQHPPPRADPMVVGRVVQDQQIPRAQPAPAPAPAAPPPAAVAPSAAAPVAANPAASASSPAAAASAANYAAHIAAAQREELATMQQLQALSSFERCNMASCNLVYGAINTSRELAVGAGLEHDTHPLAWSLPTYPHSGHGGPNQNYDYNYDIPGNTFPLGPPDPSFYLPEQLRLGRNCAEVRDKKKQQAAEAKRTAAAAAAQQPASSTIGGGSGVDSGDASELPPFEEWVLNMLLDTELQSRMESAGVLNSWTEGSHLSVVKTDGDGNCLCHALLTAAYGLADSTGALRDCGCWELGWASRRKEYLERFMAESQREIELARSLEAPPPNASAAASSSAASAGAAAAAASVPRALDADDCKSLEKEFEQLIAGMNKPSNYLEPIHIFALAHVLRRPIIVYGKQKIGGAHAQQHPDAQPQQQQAVNDDGEERKDSDRSAQAAAANYAHNGASQQSCMVGIYLPIMWRTQHHLAEPASKNNPHLKPLCLLYSCADERTGTGGHFSALVHTDGMWPEPPMVPLQQYDGYSPDAAFAGAVPLVNRTRHVPPEQPLPLLPVRFLLPKESAFVHHLLNKHLEVVQTAQGAWYARYPICRTQQYLRAGWESYLLMAQDFYARQTKAGQEMLAAFAHTGLSLSASPVGDATAAAVLAALSPSPSEVSLTDSELARSQLQRQGLVQGRGGLESFDEEVDPDDGEGEEGGTTVAMAQQLAALTQLMAQEERTRVPHGFSDVPDDSVAVQILNSDHGAVMYDVIRQVNARFEEMRSLPFRHQLRLLRMLYHATVRVELVLNQLPAAHPLRPRQQALSFLRLAWTYLMHFPIEHPPVLAIKDNDPMVSDERLFNCALQVSERCDMGGAYAEIKKYPEVVRMVERVHQEARAKMMQQQLPLSARTTTAVRAPPPSAPVPIVRPTPVISSSSVQAAAVRATAANAPAPMPTGRVAAAPSAQIARPPPAVPSSVDSSMSSWPLSSVPPPRVAAAAVAPVAPNVPVAGSSVVSASLAAAADLPRRSSADSQSHQRSRSNSASANEDALELERAIALSLQASSSANVEHEQLQFEEEGDLDDDDSAEVEEEERKQSPQQQGS